MEGNRVGRTLTRAVTHCRPPYPSGPMLQPPGRVALAPWRRPRTPPRRAAAATSASTGARAGVSLRR